MFQKIIYIIIFIFFISCNENGKPESIDPLPIQNERIYSSNSRLVDVAKFKIFHQSVSRLENTHYRYQDEERKNFQRIPGNRNGIQINRLSTDQRIQLHDLLNDILSAKGYLKISGILFSEEAPARTDDQLGTEKYWITFFGVPDADQTWGFRFEGHHISLNFSFKGDLLVSTSPIAYGTYPSIMQKGKYVALTEADFYREGLNILFEEEDKGLALIASFDSLQYNTSYSDLTTGIEIIGEDNQIYDLGKLYDMAFNSQGILFSELKEEQQRQMSNLIHCYFNNSTMNPYSTNSLLEKETKFIITGDIKKNSKFYYRIINEDFLIEFQNVGNHTHCLFRDFRNDFGTEK